MNQRLAVRLLERYGHHVQVAANGREAVEAFARTPFDLVLMDVQMPETDGFEATTAIRRGENGSAQHVAIVAMTAHAMQGDAERCMAAGTRTAPRGYDWRSCTRPSFCARWRFRVLRQTSSWWTKADRITRLSSLPMRRHRSAMAPRSYRSFWKRCPARGCPSPRNGNRGWCWLATARP
ncbi:hypothetical protein SBA6_780013 [Candidatus Sulfopaludibacter sp. SbA6]|nr:hypothetical protein SBA6_780013 [Candidatus Sulfopaludibacter sp. SbA6]